MPMVRTAKRLLCLLLVCVLLAGCNMTAPDSSGAALNTQQKVEQIAQLGQSPDDNYRTWYEIFVYSFCDSDGDGIGDLQGVISRLDYLQELGINGIWLMPIHPSSSYHKYNVEDYYAIDPAYGTLEDFDALIAACNERDIHVIIDLVLNHTGSEHGWFKEAVFYLQNLEAGKMPDAGECKYLDYYYFSQTAGAGSRPVNGTDWYYEGQFDFTMPDLNLDNEAVRSDIRDIMKYWLDKGVAGFRVDAAKEFHTGNSDKNIEFMNWLQTTAESIKPDVYMVAEVWTDFSTITNYYNSGFTSIFNFPFGDSSGKIAKVVNNAGNSAMVNTYATALEKADKAYLSGNPEYIDAPFLSNHDVGRIAGFVSRDEARVKMAGAMNLFMSGSAFIYYGEEIGMVGSGNDPSKRAPMYWNNARDNGTTDLPPECVLPDEYPFGSLEEQKNEDASIYNYYRQAVAIRNALPVISHGRTTAETALNQGCISAQRKTWGDESCIILMNIDKVEAEVDLSAYEGWTLAASLSVDNSQVKLKGTTLKIGAYGIAVLIPQNA